MYTAAVKTEFEIIIVGAGGSGLAAAVSAAEAGADVLVLEKQAEPGGTTGIAVGSFTAANTRLQARAGIDDCIEHHSEDAGRFADSDIESRNNDPLRRFFLSHAADTIHWLMDMGLVFHGPSPEPPNRVPRMHNVVPGAKAYVATLHARLVKLGGTLLTNAPVEALCRTSTGRICGVTAEIQQELRTFTARRGVVLAAGDYANSPELISRFKGEDFRCIDGINPRASGDGHRLVEQVGGRLVNMDVTYGPELRFVASGKKTFQQLLPTSGLLATIMARLIPVVPQFVVDALVRRLLVTWQHPENALFDDGAILINTRGERFCCETEWPNREIAVAGQPSKEAFILLDERLAHRYSAWPHFVSTAPKIAYAYVQDYLKLRPDVAIAANSIAQLAKKRGLSVEAVEAAVESANSDTDRTAEPLSGNRWVLLGPLRAWFTTTEGGAAIDEQFQVLDHDDRPVPGLYAVGQNGLGGQILWGHGLHIAWAMTSGRLAGKLLAGSRETPNP